MQIIGILPDQKGKIKFKYKKEGVFKYIVIDVNGEDIFLFGPYGIKMGFIFHFEIAEEYFQEEDIYSRCHGGGFMRWKNEKEVTLIGESGQLGSVNSELLQKFADFAQAKYGIIVKLE